MPEGIKLFTGNSNKTLAKEIADFLKMQVGDATVSNFSDGESMIQINERRFDYSMHLGKRSGVGAGIASCYRIHTILVPIATVKAVGITNTFQSRAVYLDRAIKHVKDPAVIEYFGF